MEETKLHGERVQVVEAMEQGLPWHEAAKCAGLKISQSTAYRLRQRMLQGGEQALREGRHGHPIKAWYHVSCYQPQSKGSQTWSFLLFESKQVYISLPRDPSVRPH